MFRNFFKIALRNLLRNKGFSLTNLLGLTIGMTCSILILLWVRDELNYNTFHANYRNIYQVIANRDFKNRIFTDRNMVLPLASAIEADYPQIKHAVVTTYSQPVVLTYGETKLKKLGYTVSQNYFETFTWKFIKGNPGSALKDPESLVFTQSAARAIFGNEDPINKVVRLDDNHNLKVTAVIADPPGNSSFQFDFIQPFNYSDPDTKRSMAEWVNSSWNVFVQTLPGANMEAVDKHINEVKKQHSPGDKVSTYFTFPMSKWELYSDFENGKNVGGMIEYVRLFSIIALIILGIACVNFMNLSTARSEKRAKEVGIRKTLGSVKRQLLIQFFVESMLLAFISFVLSILAVYLLLPAFNLLVSKHLTLNPGEPYFWIGGLGIIFFTGMVAGSYPAVYLSSFNPARVLKGTFLTGRKAALPRHVLVVTQFVISVLLISATIIVYQQIQYIKNRPVGYERGNLFMVPAAPEIQKNYAAIKDELLKSGLIASVTRISSPITEIWWHSSAPDWQGKPADAQLIMAGMGTDVDFTSTLGIKVLEGKDFSGTPADSASMLLNKAAVEAMNLKNPLGAQMRYGPSTYTVSGIIDNVVMESPFKPVEPMMVYYRPQFTSTLHLRLQHGITPQKAIPAIESLFKKYNPAVPFEYQFVDQEFGKKFRTEELISRLANIFAGLAIFICCIGLAGLASFTIEKRIREIGIRKVLGASVQQLLMLISKDFLKLVLIAFLIALPLTWWLMNNWLQKYEFRIHISIWLFAIVGILILLLTLIVVGLNTLRASMSNPVRNLRTE